MKKKLFVPVIAIGMLMTATPVFADYTVQPGDTLSQIAVKENITLSTLERLNPQIIDFNRIYPSDVIKTSQSYSSGHYDQNDYGLLARLIEAEAGGEPYAGKVAVGQVVLNRVASNQFPNTLSAVIYQPGQFTPVANGMINKPASDDSNRAAGEVLGTYTGNPDGALYYYAPSKTTNAWIRTRTVMAVIGNQVFSK